MFHFNKCFLIFGLLWLQLDAVHRHERQIDDNINMTETPDTPEEAELIFAHVLYRHGDRNPIKPYPTDPYKNVSYWPRGYGQLTNIGIQQHFELGKYLRRRYKSLIGGGKYLNDIVYVRSTDYDRTIMSAESNLAGMFPPLSEQIWNVDLIWQPVPVHTVPVMQDDLFAGKQCPRYARAMRKYLESVEFRSYLEKNRKTLKFIETSSGVKFEKLNDVQNLYNTLWIQNLRNRTLPQWTREVFTNDSDFEKLAYRDFQLQTNTTTLARLSTGFLIRDILERFTQKTEGKLSPDRTLWIYSAHDTQICSILNIFGLYKPHYPPYAASLHFELYKKGGKFYMQFFYRNSSAEELMPLDVPLCGTMFSIEKFYAAYKTFIPTESFDQECSLPFYVNIIEGNFVWSSESIVAVVVLVVILPLLIIISWKLWSVKRGIMNMKSENSKYL